MFCALLGQDIRCEFTGPLVLWFRNPDFSQDFSKGHISRIEDYLDKKNNEDQLFSH